MKFEELRKNYLDMSDIERNVFMTEYTSKRQRSIEMETVSLKPKATKKKPASRKGKTITMTKEQMELAKALGLL